MWLAYSTCMLLAATAAVDGGHGRPADATACKITVNTAQHSHHINPMVMGCHSDSGYAHQARGLSAEMLYGQAFEPVPDSPSILPPEQYLCSWIGELKDFVSYEEVAAVPYSGNTEAEKDASCCLRCDCSPDCELWVRDIESNTCYLRKGFVRYNNASTTRRGNFKNASKARKCIMPDPLQASGSGWLALGAASLDRSASPVPRGLWSAPSNSLLLSSRGSGAVNRGFAGEGLFLHAERDYVGYLVLQSQSPVTILVSLEPFGGGEAFATAKVDFKGGNWTEVHFTLTPSKGTECKGINATEAQAVGISCPPNGTYDTHYRPPGGLSDYTAHVCVQCGGQFVLTNDGHSPVQVGFASLMPGSWGRFKDLPVRADAAAVLQQMGITMIRAGGSFACDPTMKWTDWRGKVWQRPSASHSGNWLHSVVSGWGLFEVIDLCNALNVTPVITVYAGITGETGRARQQCLSEHLKCDLSAEAYGDLVEYCHGDEHTAWGRKRIADGHAEPYNVTYFELGNEQYNANFVEQVAAMEARAKKIGLPPHTLHYIWPQSPDRPSQRPNGGPKSTDAKLLNELGLGHHLILDIHTGGGAVGGVKAAKAVFATNSTRHWGAMNLETNCGDHTFHRALEEGRDLNQFFLYASSALLGRAASFCFERSSYNEGFASDQGLSFWLPNMTWLQPPGFVHAMVAKAWQPVAVNFSLEGTCEGLNVSNGDVSVAASLDGQSASVRIVNDGGVPRRFLLSMARPGEVVRYSTLAWHDPRGANTPSQPLMISPTSEHEATEGVLTVAGLSFTVATLESNVVYI